LHEGITNAGLVAGARGSGCAKERLVVEEKGRERGGEKSKLK